MKIGVDGVPLTIPFPCGTKHYAQELINALAKIDKKNEYIVFSKKNVYIPRQKNFKLVKVPTFIPILKRQFFLTYLAKKEKVDLFHFLEPYGSIFINNLKVITTVHDLNLDATYPLVSKYFYNRILCEITRFGVFKNTKVFIVVSDSTKKELEPFLKSLKKKSEIYVIPEAPDIKFKILPRRYSVKIKYFLSMGDFAPRKNIASILKAYSLLPESITSSYKLKIVASTYDAKKSFAKLAHEFEISPSVEIMENVSLDKLVELYNNACSFIYPSLFEGFGIPILEAMTCGCPVITSDRGATKETAGDAAYLVNPESVEEISHAIERIATDVKLAQKLISKGLMRAKQFSWENTAQETLKVYEKVYKS